MENGMVAARSQPLDSLRRHNTPRFRSSNLKITSRFRGTADRSIVVGVEIVPNVDVTAGIPGIRSTAKPLD